jgi:hypothetical protein
LQTLTDPSRYIEIEVKFTTPFKSIPKVALLSTTLDWQNGVPNGYILELKSVNENGNL